MTTTKKDAKVTVTAKVKPEIELKVRKLAARKDRGVSYIVNQILTEYFEKK